MSAVFSLVSAAACGSNGMSGNSNALKADAGMASADAGIGSDASVQSVYTQSDLTSDQSKVGKFTDPNLVNAWGIAYGPSTAFWVANNGTGTSTVYAGTGEPLPANNPLVVTIPLPASALDGGAGDASTGTDASAGSNTDAGAGVQSAKPTGIVYNASANFKVRSGGASAAARFLFATEDGTISGWAPTVDQTQAVIAVDNSASGAVYKGLALAESNKRPFLYATNFHAGTVEVFDRNFNAVTRLLAKGAFKDPKLPAGYAPFGIHAVGNRIYVTYAQQDKDKQDDVKGAGKGYVNVFDVAGKLLARVAQKGTLNAPWGVTVAPRKFGQFAGALLIGNFGDGTINAFDLKSHAFRGQLRSSSGKPIAIQGLWGLTFGNDKQAGKSSVLYFTAGPDDENHGLFGSISVK